MRGSSLQPAIPELPFGTNLTENTRLVLCPLRPISLVKSVCEAPEPAFPSGETCFCLARSYTLQMAVLSQILSPLDSPEKQWDLGTLAFHSGCFLWTLVEKSLFISDFHLKSKLEMHHFTGVDGDGRKAPGTLDILV